MKKNFIVSSITTVFSIPTVSLSFILITNLITPVWGKPETVEITRKTIEQEEVTLNLRVIEDNQRPALNLEKKNFTVFVDGNTISDFKWKSAKESEPKARVLFLVDFSGSMRRKDQSGTTKLQGAVRAIEAFIESAKKRGGDIQIAILPFGEGYGNCMSHIVDSQTINSKGFRNVDDIVLQKTLDYLKNYNVADLCASTNLYEPLINAVEYLADTNNKDFHPPLNRRLPKYDPRQPRQPQLSVILLSDGFHNAKDSLGNDTEAEDFKTLEEVLNNNPKIIVHTLGYGQTPEELGKKIGKAKAMRSDLYYASGRIPKGKIDAEDFVDRDRLAEIAQITDGIAEFSNNPGKIASALVEFLNALDEYEIIYQTPSAEEGRLYKVEVEVNKDENMQKTDQPEKYKISWNPLPLTARLSIFILSLIALSLFGILPWWLWGKNIKNQQE